MRVVFLFVFYTISVQIIHAQDGLLVFQSDFGLKDGAVAAMKGVALGVSTKLQIFDNTHEIPPYNIWEAAYRLNQVATYWPEGTVFVSVVDPGVGSERRSVVMKTKSGHYFVTPDNGTLTLIAETLGVAEIRIIDEALNRRNDSQQSYTFHGRDVYAYTGARLASRTISFEQVGTTVTDFIKLPYEKAKIVGKSITGSVDILDIQYGNVWTNIPRDLLSEFGIKTGDIIQVKITHQQKVVFNSPVLLGNTFADVPVGDLIAYINSLDSFSLAINQQNFADRYQVSTGPEWKVEIMKAGK